MIVSAFFVALFLGVGYCNNQVSESDLLINILIFGCIGFPVFMITFIVSLFLLRRKTNVLLLKKIDTLGNDKVHIQDAYAYENNKWFYTDYAKTIRIGEYNILVYVEQLTSKYLVFEYKFRYPEKLKNSNIGILKEHEIYINPYLGSASKQYLKKDFKKMDIRQFRTELLTFIDKMNYLEKS